ncbi:hypothetical protein ECDEC14D_4976 [Escherichia coli DEC14D]|nr:hypothetical protein ECDEC14D_4976 [Escherichia coli DEC14D]
MDEGKKYNIFKPGIDPLQVNINIAALGGYYLINQHTLGLVYLVRRKNPVLQGGDIRRGFPPNQVFAVVQCIDG